MLNRRAFLRDGAFALVSLGFAPSFLQRAVAAAGPRARDKRLIAIFQRGAVDGLLGKDEGPGSLAPGSERPKESTTAMASSVHHAISRRSRGRPRARIRARTTQPTCRVQRYGAWLS